MLSIRIVSVDHYAAAPIPELDVTFSDFRWADVKQVPIIRIFGSDPLGQKTCLHIHGVFPYIYIPYEGDEPSGKLQYQIAASLDKALNVSQGKTNSSTQHVYKIVLVSGRPFYGYHAKNHQFFKVYFYNPLLIKKATELLQSGAILNKVYQTHHAHVPFTLQFLIDYNLYGMSYINLDSAKFRRNSIDQCLAEDISEGEFLPDSVVKISTCQREADGQAVDIVNIRALELDVNPGLVGIWEDEKERRRQDSRSSQITPRSSQPRPDHRMTEGEVFLQQRLMEKLISLSGSQLDSSSTPTTPSKEKPHVSYPAEAPDDCTLLDASRLDVPVASPSSNRSRRSSGRAASVNKSVILNEQDMVLVEVLQEMAEERDVEDDSVLGSQAPVCHSDDEENIPDLSQPLEQVPELSSMATSFDSRLWEDSFWAGVSPVPQTDGADESPDDCSDFSIPSGFETRPKVTVVDTGQMKDSKPSAHQERCMMCPVGPNPQVKKRRSWSKKEATSLRKAETVKKPIKLKQSNIGLLPLPTSTSVQSGCNAQVDCRPCCPLVIEQTSCMSLSSPCSMSDPPASTLTHRTCTISPCDVATNYVASNTPAITPFSVNASDISCSLSDLGTDSWPFLSSTSPSYNSPDCFVPNAPMEVKNDYNSSLTPSSTSTLPTSAESNLTLISTHCKSGSDEKITDLSFEESAPLKETHLCKETEIYNNNISSVDLNMSMTDIYDYNPLDEELAYYSPEMTVTGQTMPDEEIVQYIPGFTVCRSGYEVTDTDIYREVLRGDPSLSAQVAPADPEELCLGELDTAYELLYAEHTPVYQHSDIVDFPPAESEVHKSKDGELMQLGLVLESESEGMSTLHADPTSTEFYSAFSDELDPVDQRLEEVSSVKPTRVQLLAEEKKSPHDGVSKKKHMNNDNKFTKLVQQKKGKSMEEQLSNECSVVDLPNNDEKNLIKLAKNKREKCVEADQVSRLARYEESINRVVMQSSVQGLAMTLGKYIDSDGKALYKVVNYRIQTSDEMPEDVHMGREYVTGRVKRKRSVTHSLSEDNLSLKKLKSKSNEPNKTSTTSMVISLASSPTLTDSSSFVREPFDHQDESTVRDGKQLLETGNNKHKPRTNKAPGELESTQEGMEDVSLHSDTDMATKNYDGMLSTTSISDTLFKELEITSVTLTGPSQGLDILPTTLNDPFLVLDTPLASLHDPSLGLEIPPTSLHDSSLGLDIPPTLHDPSLELDILTSSLNYPSLRMASPFMPLNTSSLGLDIYHSSLDSHILPGTVISTTLDMVPANTHLELDTDETNRGGTSTSRGGTSTSLPRHTTSVEMVELLGMMCGNKAMETSAVDPRDSVQVNGVLSCTSVSTMKPGKLLSYKEVAVTTQATTIGSAVLQVTKPSVKGLEKEKTSSIIDPQCGAAYKDKISQEANCLPSTREIANAVPPKVTEPATKGRKRNEKLTSSIFNLQCDVPYESKMSQETNVHSFTKEIGITVPSKVTKPAVKGPKNKEKLTSNFNMQCGAPYKSKMSQEANIHSSTKDIGSSVMSRVTKAANKVRKEKDKVLSSVHPRYNTPSRVKGQSSRTKVDPSVSLAGEGRCEATRVSHPLPELFSGSQSMLECFVRLTVLNEDVLKKFSGRLVPSRVSGPSIPCLDGAERSSSSSSSTEDTPRSEIRSPKKRKPVDTPKRGKYRPLDIRVEKSPTQPSVDRLRNASISRIEKGRPDLVADRALEQKYCQSGIARVVLSRLQSGQPLAVTSQNSQTFSTRNSAHAHTSTYLRSDHATSIDNSSSNTRSVCDKLSENKINLCYNVNIIENQGKALIKTARKKLSFPSLKVSSSKQDILKGENPSIISKFRRASADLFSDSNSPVYSVSPLRDSSDGCLALSKDSSERTDGHELAHKTQNTPGDEDEEDLGIVSFYDSTQFHAIQPDTRSSVNLEHRTVPRAFVPLSIPPTRDEVVASLGTLKIPEHRFRKPFYGDPSDITCHLEVGHRVLRLAGHSTQDLQIFESSLPGVVGLDARRSDLFREFSDDLSLIPFGCQQEYGGLRPALASRREVFITPLKLPPSYAEADLWIKSKKLLKSQVTERECEQVTVGRIGLPLIRGQGGDSDSGLSLTPNPSTPPTPPLHNPLVHAHSTPCHVPQLIKLPSPTFTPIRTTNLPTSNRIARKGSLKKTSLLQTINEGVEPLETRVKPSPIPRRGSSDYGSPTSPDMMQSKSSSPTFDKTSFQLPHASLEDQSLHKLLLQTQFRQNLITPRRASSTCEIEGATGNTYGFRMSLENLQDAKAATQHQFLTILALELLTDTREELMPDPEHDAIRALFYVVTNDVPDDHKLPKQLSGAIVVEDSPAPLLRHSGVNCEVLHVADERGLVSELVALVRRWDPDVLVGYEIETLSWGYLLQRAAVLKVNLSPEVSRVPTASRDSRFAMDEDRDIKLVGRIVLDVWRLMRSEVTLMNYSFENVMFHVLHQRVPLHSFRTLAQWWGHRTNLYRHITMQYYMLRVHGTIQLLDQLDIIGRTSELARLFGIQFYEVLSRGSQFRVESMMLRLAKPLNYVPVSPTVQQRAKMRAPECIPLIMEPKSNFYSDPVIVLDFQSLYPSIIIAYNYCYSTCLGRIEHLGSSDPFEFGCTQLKVPPSQLLKLQGHINISPNGVAFVKEDVRRGVLPRMLEEILETRLMVKKSMKEHKDKTLQRVLHSRQLGLKLIANVTYGYTAANFSGRMPCIEVGDSVVSKGRETLERAIHLVKATERWGATVVYGDTDSLFVLVRGRSREQAFAIGAEIAEAVTLDNPKPIKLKLEKVYQPCILQTKKRYVGYMYESADQVKPTYEAKGIETVRRDGCPAVAKVLEKSLRILFESQDVSLVKKYVCRQFDKLLQGRSNMQDLVYAREYRGMAGYRPGACVPALELTRRWLKTDRRAEPRPGQRVPYVIVTGPPGVPLIRLVRSPHEVMADPSLKINTTYYITRALVPPLDRCFSLLGADVGAWYAEMPHKSFSYLPTDVLCDQKKSTISQYFATTNCAVCNRKTNCGVCAICKTWPQKTTLILHEKVRIWERNFANISQVCQSCCRRSFSIDCQSLDCSVLFRKHQASRDLDQVPFVRRLLDQYSL